MKRAMKQSTLTLILNGISILTLIYMVYSLIAYSQVSGQLNTANEERFSLTYNANRFMNGSAYLTNEVRAFAATGDQQHYDNYWSEVNDLQNRDKGVAALQEIGITDEEQGMIDDMFALSNRLVPLEENAMEEVQAGNMAEAVSYVYGTDYSESIAQINALKEQFLADLDQRSLTQVQELQARAEAIRMSMILALVMVGVIQLLNMVISRIMIMRPVLKVKEQMMEISQGNLSAEFSLEPNTSEIGMLVASIHETKGELKKYIKEIDHTLAQMAQGNMNLAVGDDYRGEFLPIQDAMRQILDSLNQALSRIHLTAERVSEESERMASDAQTLSNGNVQQAAAVQQLSSSIHEISKQVDQTSRDADDAKQASEDASMQLRMSPGGGIPKSSRSTPEPPPSSATVTMAVRSSVYSFSPRRMADRPCPPPRAAMAGPFRRFSSPMLMPSSCPGGSRRRRSPGTGCTPSARGSPPPSGASPRCSPRR